MESVGANDSGQPPGGFPAEAPATPPLRVFINYRHEDMPFAATMLYQELQKSFGKENIFFDEGTLRPGMRFLEEIKQLLKERHGEIPVVMPSRSNSKREHLFPERYLFQWDALSAEPHETISTADAQVLLRFMLHGLDLYRSQGKPIRVGVHFLRNVMSTHARQ